MKKRSQRNSEFFKQWHQENEHPMQGKNHTEEAKQKISEASIKLWKEEPEKMKEAHKRGGATRTTPKEKELKIIEAYLKNNELPIQDQRTVRELVKEYGIGTSSLYRILARHNIAKNMNFSGWTGQKHTEETKAKMAGKRSEYWENKNIDTSNE